MHRIISHSCSSITHRTTESPVKRAHSVSSIRQPEALETAPGKNKGRQVLFGDFLRYKRSLKLIGVDVENMMKKQEEETTLNPPTPTPRPRTAKPTMSTRVKMRSVSVEDLGNIVKQMIDGALEDTEQVAKLHQAVYEEWYFKKMAELKKAKTEQVVVQNHPTEKETEGEISETQVSHRIRRPKSGRRSHISQALSLVESTDLIRHKTSSAPHQPEIYADSSSTNVREDPRNHSFASQNTELHRNCSSVPQQPDIGQENNEASKNETVDNLPDCGLLTVCNPNAHVCERGKTASVHWNPNIIIKETHNHSALNISLRSKANIITPPKSAMVLRPPPEEGNEHHKKTSTSNTTSYDTHTKVEMEYNNVIDAPVIHTLRRTKTATVKMAPAVTQLTNRSNPVLQPDLPDDHTELHLIDRVQTSMDISQLYHTAKDSIETVKLDIPDQVRKEQFARQEAENTDLQGVTNNEGVEMIEVWANSKQKKLLYPEKNKTRKIPLEIKSRGEIAFENWKREKTKAFNRSLKEQQKARQQQQITKAVETEKKRAANEAYLRWRKQQETQQKLSYMKKKAVESSAVTQKHQSDEKRSANAQAFKAWKRQKDVKLRERRMYMMAYTQQPQQQQQQQQQQSQRRQQRQEQQQQQSKLKKTKRGPDVAFNIWLDQLDCVLHQKYLRERRYLVRSFYCQPAYYGTASLCSR